MLRLVFTTLWLCLVASPASALTVGAEQPARYLPLLKNKNVALVVNQTSRVQQTHLVDYLLQQQVNVVNVMAPEHGFRGQQGAGEHIADNTDAKTGLPITSLYGATKKPTARMLRGVDVIVFDIQDVGARFYTYISTLHYVLEAAAQQAIPVIVLDRPNPNGRFVDGPVREAAFSSFVGVDPLPVLHGMTVGELALMIQGENWIEQAQSLALTIIDISDYQRDMPYTLPYAPSPNLPNATAIRLYPSLCFFEATSVSIGRGTDLPFQVAGHSKVRLGSLTLTPTSRPQAAAPKLAGQQVWYKDLRHSAMQGLDLSLFIETYQQFMQANETFFTAPAFMDKLAGTDKLRKAIEQGQSINAIRATWQADLEHFRKAREPYLLYP